MKSTTSALTLLSLTFGAAAHGGILEYTVNGKAVKGINPYNTPEGQSSAQRLWKSYDPVQDVTLPAVACNDNGGANPGQLTEPIEAGQEVVSIWNDWPHPTGPVIAYLSKCAGTTCDDAVPTEQSWFKIAEAGLLSGTISAGLWGAADMKAKNNSWPVTIPATVPAGEYLLRVETIALHSMPAQVYPQCLQLSISNAGTAIEPSADLLVKFPGAYKQTDPGLTVDLYGQASQQSTTYVIPGPALYPGNGSAPAPPPPPPATNGTTTVSSTSTSVPADTTTTSTVTSVPTDTTTSSGSSTTVAPPPSNTETTTTTTTSTAGGGDGSAALKYGQCGGINFSGPTTCVQGTVCTVQNPYYSQCI